MYVLFYARYCTICAFTFFFIDVLHVKYEMDYVCKHICKLTSVTESMPSNGEHVYKYLKNPSVN